MTPLRQGVRPSPIAGTWYPADASQLRSNVEAYLHDAQPAPPSAEVVGLLAPHAGLLFSGKVAAHAFKLIVEQAYDTVVVLGPLHRLIPSASTAAVISTAHSAYHTPLGDVPVDHTVLDQLATCVPSYTQCVDDPEHSIEIELPFLQVALPAGFTLVPLMLRDQSLKTSQQLGIALADLLQDRRVLFVASSDLSHFYPQQIAATLDQNVLNAVAQMDAAQVIDLEARGEGFACGRGAIAATIYAAQRLGADKANCLHHATSGDITGDVARVVGYGAAGFFRTH
jgi:AmmeMemoRadiSam system protein B